MRKLVFCACFYATWHFYLRQWKNKQVSYRRWFADDKLEFTLRDNCLCL